MKSDQPQEHVPFQLLWDDQPHIEGGVYLPLDAEKRTPHPSVAPQHILDMSYVARDQRSSRWASMPSASPLPPLEIFHLFPDLPTELRRMIWRHTLPGHRVVEIFYDEETDVCTSSCEQPMALRICQESRQEALKSYRPSFATNRASATIYFDFDVDELYIGIGNISPGPLSVLSLFLSLDSNDLSRIRNIAIDEGLAVYNDPDEEEPAHYGVFWTIANSSTGPAYALTSLESLTFVVIPSHYCCNDSPFVHFRNELFLTEVENRPGEFQAWSAQRNSLVVPWSLPLYKASWEIDVSMWWCNLEVNKQDMGRKCFPLKTVRWVHYRHLSIHDQWRKRVDFLSRKMYVPATGCLYDSGSEYWMESTLRQLLDFLEDDRDTYDDLGRHLPYKLSSDVDYLDPIDTYLSTTECVCGSGHAKRATIYDRETLAEVDLEADLDLVLRERGERLAELEEWSAW